MMKVEHPEKMVAMFPEMSVRFPLVGESANTVTSIR